MYINETGKTIMEWFQELNEYDKVICTVALHSQKADFLNIEVSSLLAAIASINWFESNEPLYFVNLYNRIRDCSYIFNQTKRYIEDDVEFEDEL